MARLRVKITSYLLMITLILLVLPLPPLKQSLSGAEEVMHTRRTIIVNASGGGDHTHIQWAIDNASNGDVILVEAGTYYENVVINKTISLIGAGSYNTTIYGNGKGDKVQITMEWVNMSGFNVVYSGSNSNNAGIYGDEIRNCKIENNTLHSNGMGIEFTRSSSNTIANNTCNSNKYSGIRLRYYCSDNIIINNTCSDNYAGIRLDYYSNSNTIVNNTCTENYDGISLDSSINNYLSGNYISSNNRNTGIRLEECTSIKLNSNQITNCGIVISGNSLIHWNTHSIDMSNRVNSKAIYYLKNQTGGIVPSHAGEVILANCTNILVTNQKLNNGTIGIAIGYSSECKILNNRCENNSYGIYLECSSGNTIANNNCSNNNGGIHLTSSYANIIKNNICNYCPGGGYSSSIYLESSCSNTIANNTCLNNWNSIYLYDYSNDNVLTNNTCSNNTYGIGLAQSNNNNISKNTCNSNSFGIQLYYCSDNNIVTENICKSNTWQGFSLSHSNRNAIANNIFSLNNGHGITLYSARNKPCNFNTITNNILSNNSYGTFFHSNGDSFYGNTIITNIYNSNTYYGISLAITSTKNIIHSNTFINNNRGEIQASDNGTMNCWNSSVVGNYWADWPDIDIDGNWVVDLPYNIDGIANAKDFFPMVKPLSDLLPIANAGSNITIDQHDTITFNGSASWGFQNLTNYTWSFTYRDTPNYLYGPFPSFTFHIAGIYLITLEVIDGLARSAMDTMYVAVIDTTPPIANAGPDIIINQSATVDFFFHQDCSDNVFCWNWTWTFEYNGKIQMVYRSITMSVPHLLPISSFTFDMPGNYSVTMTVYDEAGNWAVDMLNITVLDSSLPKGIDSDKDTYNDTYELEQGSDPYNPLSTPLDWDADGWNNSIELEVGTDSRDNLSVPPDMDRDGIPDSIDSDRDGDDVPNVSDTYPNDPDRWDSKGEDEEKDSRVYLWVGILIFVSIIAIAGVILYLSKKKKEKEVEQSSVDDLGRVEKGEIEESE